MNVEKNTYFFIGKILHPYAVVINGECEIDQKKQTIERKEYVVGKLKIEPEPNSNQSDKYEKAGYPSQQDEPSDNFVEICKFGWADYW